MLNQLENLVAQFETGQLGRRDFLGAVMALTYSTVAPKTRRTGASFKMRNFTHVNIRVRDVNESEKFYRELFDLPRARGLVGAAFGLDLPDGGLISLCPMNNPDCGMNETPKLGEIDHFGVGIENFKEVETARQLKDRGLETYDSGTSVFVKDPNGTWVQVSAPKEAFKRL